MKPRALIVLAGLVFGWLSLPTSARVDGLRAWHASHGDHPVEVADSTVPQPARAAVPHRLVASTPSGSDRGRWSGITPLGRAERAPLASLVAARSYRWSTAVEARALDALAFPYDATGPPHAAADRV